MASQVERLMQTRDGFTRDALVDAFTEVIRGQVVPLLQLQSGSMQAPGSPLASGQGQEFQLFHWGGHFHRAPEGFEFPKVDVSQAWELWHLGHPARRICAYRSFQGSDLSTEKARKQLSDWCVLFQHLENRLLEELQVEVPSSSSFPIEDLELIRTHHHRAGAGLVADHP